MNLPMPEVDDDVLRQRVSQGSYTRGRAYAEEGAVLGLEWDGNDLSSTVLGTAPAPYRCRISIVKVGTLWIPMAMGCSCPVRTGCKHAVATLIMARREAHMPTGGSDWRSAVESVIPAQRGTAPLALGFYLRTRPGPGQWRSRLHPAVSEEEAFDQGKRLDLLLRPMTRGKSGAWIKGGLTWRGLAYELGYRGEQLMWMRQLLGLYDGTRATTGGVDHDGLAIHDIHGPMLWDLFEEAERAGIELVPEKSMTLTLAKRAHVQIRVAREGENLTLARSAEIDGEPVSSPWFPIGGHGIYTYRRTSTGFDVTLAPTTETLPHLAATLADPIDIPGSDEEEFFEQFLPQLRRAVTVEAGEGVRLPEYRPPLAQLTCAYDSHDRLRLTWSWEYYSPPGSYSLTSAGGSDRDSEWEQEVSRALEAVWPGWEERQELTGVEVAEFTTDTLPRIEAIEGVAVEVRGERPQYTRLDGNPHIRITAVASDRTDWFDLGFEVTIDGKMIPFPELFAALSKGEQKLLLVDRSYLSLDHPALEHLRDLLERASDIPEWEPERPRISTYQIHFWEEFEDLADETVQARQWRETVAGLRDVREIPELPPPPELRAELREYQHEGFTWLAFLHRAGLGGILADDMGLGKTLQTLALITHAVRRGPGDPFLIIAPTSVVSTWTSEAAKFTPHLNVVPITRTRRKRGSPLTDLTREADVVVTSYTIARLDAEEFCGGRWAGLVLDEAQFVKNPTTRLHQAISQIQAPFRLAITGTPMENSLTDLWSLMSITAPGLFPSARKFRENYVRPIENNNDADRLAELRRMIRPFMLRRTKEQVAPELPPKQEQLLEVELSAAHRRVYEATLQRERQKVLGLIDDLDKNRFIVFRSLTLLRMLALAPGLVDEEHAHLESAKLTTLLAHILDIASEGHRVLVFSQFTSFLKMAADECAAHGVEYEYLDGSTTNRGSVIESFRSGQAPVFFISLKAGGFGLTLTEADYVFVLDPWWNPAAESQAVDRTHRIGQTRSVMVYRMVARETIEEKVMALQQKKAALFASVVDDDAHFSKGLTVNDIRGLFG